MQALYIYETHSLAKEQQVQPVPLNDQLLGRADWGEIRRGVATQRDFCGDEAGVREISPMVMIDLDLTGENTLEEGLNITIPVRPVYVDEVSAHRQQNDHR